MEAAWSCNMLVSYNTTWDHKPEELNLNLHHHENLKSHMSSTICQSVIYDKCSILMKAQGHVKSMHSGQGVYDNPS